MVILTAPYELTEEIKKSRFICRVQPVGSDAEALVFIEEVRAAERKANHNCWAFVVGGVARSSDDGEPGGTAGRPMLGALEKQGVDRVVAVVTRHFGGIKLGAGGLARAYGGITARCVQQAPKKKVHRTVTLTLEVPFEHFGQVRPLLERHDATLGQEIYSETGATFELTLQPTQAEALKEALATATSGKVTLDSP